MTKEIRTDMWIPRGNTYFSETKNETINIKDMNYMHLANTVRSIENEARVMKQEIRKHRPDDYSDIEFLPLPTLAATLCPIYEDLAHEYRERNKQGKKQDINKTMQTSFSTVDQGLLALINSHQIAARNSLEVVKQLAPTSVLSDLEDIEKLLDEVNQLIIASKPGSNVVETGVTAETATAQVEVQISSDNATPVTQIEQPTNPEIADAYLPIAEFNFGPGSGQARNKIAKYFSNIKSVEELDVFTLMDLLTFLTGEQVYNIVVALAKVGVFLKSSDYNSFYEYETDLYPKGIDSFIKKPHHSRKTFEACTNVTTLNSISISTNSLAWIKEADRISENIKGRARYRYRMLANYIKSFVNDSVTPERAVDRVLVGCTRYTRDQVLRWVNKRK